jgi:cytochrome oxidase Cu insertion factor (SCO1/SenC/PrrC family)
MRRPLGDWRWRGLHGLLVLLIASGCAYSTAKFDQQGPRALPLDAWRWTDDAGDSVTLAELRGEPVVLSMFFRSCNFACPLTLARMQGLEHAFELRHNAARFVLVTLDPTRDSPERLASFRAEHGLSSRWRLLVGSLAQTVALSRWLAVKRIQDDTHILHDVRIVVLSADQRRMRVFEGWNFDDASALSFRAPPSAASKSSP